MTVFTAQPSTQFIAEMLRNPLTWVFGVPYTAALVFLVIGIAHRFKTLTKTSTGKAGFALIAFATVLSFLVRIAILVSISLGRVYIFLVIAIFLTWLTGILLTVQRDLEAREGGEHVKWQHDVTIFGFLAVAILALLCAFHPAFIQGA